MKSKKYSRYITKKDALKKSKLYYQNSNFFLKIDMLSNKIKMMGDARLVYQDMDYKNKLNEIRREKYAAKDQVDLQFERKLIAVYKRYTM